MYRKSCTNELVVWKEIYLQRANETERNSALNEVRPVFHTLMKSIENQTDWDQTLPNRPEPIHIREV